MELRQLRYVDAVARLKSFTRAAEELRVAQPSVSQQVRALERELGVTLFERTTRAVRLTNAGSRFLDDVRPALDKLDEARDRTRRLAAYAGESVRIGATLAHGGLDLIDILAAFRADHPHVTLSLSTGVVADLLARLEAGDLDLVVGPTYPEHSSAAVRTERLLDDELVLVVGQATAARISQMADAVDEPFACLPVGSGLRRLLDRAAAAYGFEPRVLLEVPSPQEIRSLVAADLGVAVLARSVVRGPGPPVVVRTLERAPGYPPIGLHVLRSAASRGPAGDLAKVVMAAAEKVSVVPR